jgi:mRNA interferase MazF
MAAEIKRGQIYMADLNPVIGSEQGGIRPVVIIQNDRGNRFSPTVIVAAITGQDKRNLPTHTKLKTTGLPKESTALLEQIRTLDKSRLLEKLGDVSESEMNRITEALRVSIDV